jgi:hypothetical protein
MIYDITYAKDVLKDFHEFCDSIGFKRAESFGRRTGGSAERNNLSEYEYIRTSRFIKEPKLYRKIKDTCTKLSIWQHALVHYVLQLQPNDFLDLQDDWQRDDHNKPLGKFFSIALTEGNKIIIEDKEYLVPQYHAIEFSPTDLHEIKPVNNKQTWLVFMVPKYLNVSESIINRL